MNKISRTLFRTIIYMLIVLSLTACTGKAAPTSTPTRTPMTTSTIPSIVLTKATSTISPTMTPTSSPTATATSIPTRTLIPIPTSKPFSAPTQGPYLYQIQAGDTLVEIADKCNVSLHDLININKLGECTRTLMPGDTLTIPKGKCTSLPEEMQPTMPDYYRSNPALTWIASEETPFRWIDDTHFAVLDSSLQARGDWCAGEVWNVYDLSYEFTEVVNPCAIFPECMTPPPEPNHPPEVPGFFPGDVAPDGSKALSIDWVEYGAATPVGIKLGHDVTDQTVYEQVYLVDLKDGTVTPLFYSPEFFIYQWADDSRHLVGIGNCYDMVGTGLFTFDTQTGEVYWINEVSILCEGGKPPMIAPGSAHLIDDSGVVRSLHGAQRGRICKDNEFARSYAWSDDGRYAFASCSSGRNPEYQGSDVIHRYDTQTGQIKSLTDPEQVTFKAIELYPSPDGARLMFKWGTNNFDNYEPYGIWLLDPEKKGVPCGTGFTRLKVGDEARVTPGSPNRIRSKPSIQGEVLTQLDPGTVVKIIEGPVCRDGLVFWRVEHAAIPGGSGWTAEGDGKEYYLESISDASTSSMMNNCSLSYV